MQLTSDLHVKWQSTMIKGRDESLKRKEGTKTATTDCTEIIYQHLPNACQLLRPCGATVTLGRRQYSVKIDSQNKRYFPWEEK